jgi:hypothetical protein
MSNTFSDILLVLFSISVLLMAPSMVQTQQQDESQFQPSLKAVAAKLGNELSEGKNQDQQKRIERGLSQAAQFWRAEDGDAQAFEAFARKNMIVDQPTLDETFKRLEFIFEQTGGHMLEIQRDLRRQTDLDLGPILPVDELLAAYDPSANLNDDLFKNKLAFLVLLNFPLTSLEERLGGEDWSRRHWAEVRLAQIFSRRIPGDVNLQLTKALSDADQYISEYNIWMHHLVNESGERLFPAGMRLITHWNLRDELKADYFDPKGFAKQKMIAQVMERIVTQTIPTIVINNPNVDWDPFTNEVKPSTVNDSEKPAPKDLKISTDAETDHRYKHLLNIFQANRSIDRYSPTQPTLIDRRFNENREIPEERVKKMFEQILTSPFVPKTAEVIKKRLGRDLQPFDIWYSGFKARGKYTEEELDAIVSKKYPNAEAYAADIPNLLQKLGFNPEISKYLADRIVVDPSRGAGHAMGAARREDKAHLRTRVEKTGMNYKGYNIAIHEMGHNVEQIISLNKIDHTLLQGVPNTAFTEALAFVFQARDLELLGLSKPDEQSKALQTLATFWNAYEMAGVSLVDMEVWKWMYDNPDTTPAQLKESTLQISKDIWNKYYAPIFGQKDVVLLGIYSHMIDSMLYLPDYPIGHMITVQVEEKINQSGNLGAEFERVCLTGAVVPDLWMKTATGAPVGPEALLRQAEKALSAL